MLRLIPLLFPVLVYAQSDVVSSPFVGTPTMRPPKPAKYKKRAAEDYIAIYERPFYCGELPPNNFCKTGDEKYKNRPCKVEIEEIYSPAQVAADYVVSKSDVPRTYNVHISYFLDFLKSNRADGLGGLVPASVEKDKRQEFLNHVNQCLKKHRSYLTDGQRYLNITVSENHKPKYNNVTVDLDSTVRRQHSRLYNKNISCSTAVHEVLHLMGLCDHYAENDEISDAKLNFLKQQRKKNPIWAEHRAEIQDNIRYKKYDCRDEQRANELNYMNNHRRVASIPSDLEYYKGQLKELQEKYGIHKHYYTETVCECPKTPMHFSCSASLPSDIDWYRDFPYQNVIACPEGINQTTSIKGSDKPVKDSVVKSNSKAVILSETDSPLKYYEDQIKKFTRDKQSITGLTSEQIETILHPLCMQKPLVKQYYIKSANAYRSSIEDGCLEVQ